MNSIWSTCFEVKVSPKQKRPLEEDNICFILAPFQKGPVINFKNVKVGCTKVKALPVINGTRSPIEVKLTKCPPQFTFNLSEFTVPASGSTELEISWTPLESGSWRHVVKVQTDTILKFDLVMICSSMVQKFQVVPKKSIKRLKPIAGDAQYRKNSCASGVHLGFGNSIENTKLIATDIDSSSLKLLENGPECLASVYNTSNRRETMVISKNKLSCNKENMLFEREKCFQKVSRSKISNIDEIYVKSKLNFEDVSFTGICDDKLKFCLENNEKQIKNRKSWNLLDNITEGILYQHADDEYNSKRLEAKHKVLQSNKKIVKKNQSFSDSDKFSDSLEDSVNITETDKINVSISSPLMKEVGNKILSDINSSFDLLGGGEISACMKSKNGTTNTDFRFAPEAKTDKPCSSTQSWLKTPEVFKHCPDIDVENRAGRNLFNSFCFGDTPLQENKLYERDNAIHFSSVCTTPTSLKYNADFTEVNDGHNVNMTSNFERKTGKILNANVNKFNVTEFKELNHREKIGTMLDHESLTDTPKKMPVEIENLSYWEKVGTVLNSGHDSLITTPKKMPVEIENLNHWEKVETKLNPGHNSLITPPKKMAVEIENLNYWENVGTALNNGHDSLITPKKMAVEIESLNYWENVGTVLNHGHSSLITTPKKMPVLCGGETVIKKNYCDDKSKSHFEFVGLDFCNGPTEVNTSYIKVELESGTSHSAISNDIRVLQFSPPKRKMWKSSPKLCLGNQTRLKVYTKKRSPKYNAKKSVNREAQAAHKSLNKNSSVKNSSYCVRNSKLSLKEQKNRPKKSVQLYDPDIFISNIMNPSLHSNPFIENGMYCDLEWIDLQERNLIKWLNTLFSPPDELATVQECHRVDVVKLWQQVQNQNNVKLSKSLEQVPLHTNDHLSTLRKAARTLFQADALAKIFCRIVTHIDKQLITLREDRNFFNDIGLQHKLLALFLCYNPLWLRIGLETVYGKTVPVESNSDTGGLVSFIMHNFLESRYLKQKFPNPNEYMKNITKLALKKFLMLVYFLDQAKTKRLIGLNPCLFTKNAHCKASRDILLSFSREFLSGMGDITKHLKTLGFVVCHEQMYIDEFDFSVRNHLDLSDGIRLCKVMEIILHDKTILYKLRTPAISKLQKLHNVSIALNALEAAGYKIAGGITSNDIVNGHREKIFSLLWQIIHNFQRPKFVAAAIKLQKWWRSLIWQKKFNNSVILKRQLRAAVTIQNRVRANNMMRKERSTYLHFKGAVIKIQHWYRASLLMKTCRIQYIMIRTAALKIQNWYRATILMRHKMILYNKYKHSAMLIQSWIRHINKKKIMLKKQRENMAAILIQRKFLSWKQRKYFISLKSAVILLQRKFRENQKQKYKFEDVQRKILAAVRIQQWYRRRKNEYLSKVRRISAATLIQRKYRAYRAMWVERKNFISIRAAAVVIQRRFKANRLEKMIGEREQLIMEQKVSAATKIQAFWRGYSVRKVQPNEYKDLYRNIKRLKENDKVCETIRTIYTSTLDSLLMKVHLKQSKKELRILSDLTEVSKELCSDFAVSKYLLKIFLWLKNSNRSLPFQNVCLSATKILVNLVRDPRNHFYVLQVQDSVNIILQLISKYVTIDNDIFCNCCKILWLLAQDNVTAQVIRNVRDCESRLLLYWQKAKKRQTIGCSSNTPGSKKEVIPSKHVSWKEPVEAIEILLHTLEVPMPTKLKCKV